MKKSITLIELLISLVLIGAVVSAVFGIYNASLGFFTSSDTKSVVLNEMAYLLDHIDKNVYMATGWIDNPAITVITPAINQFRIDINKDPNHTPINFGDDIIDTYIFDINNNAVTFEGNLLTNKLIQHPDPAESLTINYNAAGGALTIDNLCFRYEPGNPADPSSNPVVCITGQRFSTLMQSLN